MRCPLIVFTVIALCTASACGPDTSATGRLAVALRHDLELSKRERPRAQTVDEARRLFENRTHMHFNSYQATWVEYFAPDGNAYIYWSRAARFVQSGQWKIEAYEEAIGNQVRSQVRVCLLYQSNAIPYEFQKAGTWHCRPPPSYLQYQVDEATGDPLRLSAGAPSLLGFSGRRTTIEALTRPAAPAAVQSAPPTPEGPSKSGEATGRSRR